MQIGVLFGNGETVDLLPDSLFARIWADDLVSIGCNRAPICRRFQEVGFAPTAYCAFDDYDEKDERNRTILEHLKKWAGHVDLYLPDTWPIGHIKVPYGAHTHTGEWAAKILFHEYGCREIWMLGCDAFGGHHQCEPPIHEEPLGTQWESKFHTAAARVAWRLLKRNYKTLNLKVWPAASQLHPDPIPDLVEW